MLAISVEEFLKAIFLNYDRVEETPVFGTDPSTAIILQGTRLEQNQRAFVVKISKRCPASQ
jgi:hypothetical protein